MSEPGVWRSWGAWLGGTRGAGRWTSHGALGRRSARRSRTTKAHQGSLAPRHAPGFPARMAAGAYPLSFAPYCSVRQRHMYGQRTWDGDPHAGGVVGPPLHLDGVAVVDHLRGCGNGARDLLMCSRARGITKGLVRHAQGPLAAIVCGQMATTMDRCYARLTGGLPCEISYRDVCTMPCGR